MNKLIRFFFMICLLSCHGYGKAQETNNDSADSLQRIIMKDSLNVADSSITRVFQIRNNFLIRSTTINADTILTDEQRSTAMEALIAETNSGIRNALGNDAYDHYMQMIRRKLAMRTANRTQPLASQNGN